MMGLEVRSIKHATILDFCFNSSPMYKRKGCLRTEEFYVQASPYRQSPRKKDKGKEKSGGIIQRDDKD